MRTPSDPLGPTFALALFTITAIVAVVAAVLASELIATVRWETSDVRVGLVSGTATLLAGAAALVAGWLAFRSSQRQITETQEQEKRRVLRAEIDRLNIEIGAVLDANTIGETLLQIYATFLEALSSSSRMPPNYQ